MKPTPPPRHKGSILWRGWRLRCPRCGAGALFRHGLTMHERCAACQWRFEREQGYFLGAMYINYAMTVSMVLIGYFSLEWYTDLPLVYHLVLWGSASLLCPLLLFRHSRGLWLSFDYLMDPGEDTRQQPHEEGWHGKHG
jgi:uncharacterized protein (DUF983 family)